MRARFVLLAVLSFSSEAMADSTVRFLICQPGGPDVSEHDQKVLGRMYRYLEREDRTAQRGNRGRLHQLARALRAGA